MRKIITISVLVAVLFIPVVSFSIVITESEFNEAHHKIDSLPVGDRVAFWAEKFVGTPYDPDPLGEYVRNRAIIADDRVDCMYMTFRTVELAMSKSYAGTVQRALTVRFHTRGKLDSHGKVTNYDDRYRYGIAMIRSGKFGRDVSAEIGRTTPLKGARGINSVDVILNDQAVNSVGNMKNGDIIFFVKDPEKRKVGEIIGHIGIVSVKNKGIFLIHASGIKNGSGAVKKVARSEEHTSELQSH